MGEELVGEGNDQANCPGKIIIPNGKICGVLVIIGQGISRRKAIFCSFQGRNKTIRGLVCMYIDLTKLKGLQIKIMQII